MTAYGSEEVAVEAMRKGADDYIAKGRMQIDELEMRIAKALRSNSLEAENKELKQQLSSRHGMENIIGQSFAMVEVLDVVRQVAPTRASVLVLGENGTGKEMVAKAIHQLSPRAEAPLISVHCAALSPTLLESELFGHEKGAFTNAHERRIGRFEQANGGTLFLDEIGEIDATTQVKLLRFLGERTFERVGSNKTQTSDVRIIAATNKDLAKMVQEETFREDLYFRLKVVVVNMPPLRDRAQDVPLLANAFLKEYARENGKKLTEFRPEVLEAMMEYRWPGNVRELRSAVERAVIFATPPAISLRDLPKEILGKDAMSVSRPEKGQVVATSGMTVKDAERELIIQALRDCDGNRTKAAQKIGMSRRTLHRKLHEYHLEDF